MKSIFALALLLSFSAHAQNWRVDFGGAAQPGYTDSTYVPLHFSNVEFSSGMTISTTAGSVTIQTAGLYVFGGQTWVDSGVGSSNPFTVTKYFKNGMDLQGCTGIGGLQFLGTSTMDHTCLDQAAVGDVYQLQFYGTATCSTCTMQIDGNRAHTFWWGAKVQ